MIFIHHISMNECQFKTFEGLSTTFEASNECFTFTFVIIRDNIHALKLPANTFLAIRHIYNSLV